MNSARRMRLAVYYNVAWGGGRRWLYECVARLRERHDVDLYCISRSSIGRQFPDGSDLAQWSKITPVRDLPKLSSRWLKPVNTPALWVDLFRFDRAARRVAREIDAGHYDLLFAAIGDYTEAPLVLRHAKTRSVYFCHQPMRAAYETPEHRPYDARELAVRPLVRAWQWLHHEFAGTRRRWDRQATLAATRVFANSRYTRDAAARAYGVDAAVNLLGVDVDEFQPGGAHRERFVLGVGEMVRWKGFDWTVRAVGAIAADRRPRLVVVSNRVYEPERRYVEQVARECDVQLDLRSPVADAELKSLYQRASVVLYTPHREPFGLVPLEAMASGAPVVAVREGGPAETVTDGETGFLCERDARQLGEAVQRLLDDDALRERMSRAARAHAVRSWSWERSVGELEELLIEVVEGKRKSKDGSRASDPRETSEMRVARSGT